jgi:hypothetical protein
MSVANEANNKLQQLVNLTTQIKNHLVSGEGSKKEEKAGTATTETAKGSPVDSAKEAMAIGGMATSIAKLIIATNVLSTKAGVKVKDFLVDFSEGLRDASKNIENVNSEELINSLTGLSKSLLTFAFGMTAIAVLAPAVALGTIVFMLAIKGILTVLKTADENAGKGADALATLMGIGSSIALFALTMVGIALVAPLFALGTLVFVLAIKGILWALKSADDNAGKGASALDTLMKIGKYVAIFALTMVGIGFFAKQFALGALVFVLAIGAITLVLNQIGKKEEDITKGVNILKSMIKPLLFFGIIMGIAGVAAQFIAIGALVMSLSVGLIGLAAYGLGKLDKDGSVKKGTGLISALALPMLAFSAAIAIVGTLVKDDPLTLALKVGVIGLAIVILGLAARVLGDPGIAPYALIGVGIIEALALPMIAFAGTLVLLSQAEFTKEKVENLAYAIMQISWTMSKLGIIAPFVLIGAAAIIPASAALLPLTFALAIFKTIDWQESDGAALQNALTSTVQGFSHALDGLGVAGVLKAMAAIPMIALMGLALVSLAAGVKAMATLSFTEMEYDAKSKKLVPKRVVKLTDAEIQQVGPNVAKILNAVAGPLTNFGKWASESNFMFGPFSLGSSYMLKGIDAAAKVGNAISGIAKGVADMANLNIVEYEVKNGKVVPKSVRKLSDADFTLAGDNTASILNALVNPLSTFGKEASKGEGKYWGDGYVVKGIEAAAKVGNAISGIAKGVIDMANLNIVEYVVKNGKLVPVSTRKLTTDDFTNAATNVDEILTALTAPLTQFGKDYKNGSSWFTDSALEAGIEATGKIVDPIAKMADMVLKLASGQATINEVINPGTKNAKLVAKGTINFADAIPLAIANAKKLLYAFPQIFASLGIYLDKWEDKIDTAIEFMPKMSSAMKDVLSVSKSYLGITKNIAESSKDGKNIDGVLTGFATSLATMGKSFDKMDNNKVTLYKRFASITEGMTKINTPFEKFTKNFGQFTKDMGVFVKVWDAFGKDDATNLKTYADSLKTIASVDAGKLSATTKALKEQAQAQAALNNMQKSTTGSPAAAATTEAAKTTTKGNTNTSSPQFTPSQQAPAAVAQQGGLGSGAVIARLEVTNLYINGKLSK